MTRSHPQIYQFIHHSTTIWSWFEIARQMFFCTFSVKYSKRIIERIIENVHCRFKPPDDAKTKVHQFWCACSAHHVRVLPLGRLRVSHSINSFLQAQSYREGRLRWTENHRKGAKHRMEMFRYIATCTYQIVYNVDAIYHCLYLSKMHENTIPSNWWV